MALTGSPAPQWTESSSAAKIATRLVPVKTVAGYWIFLPSGGPAGAVTRDTEAPLQSYSPGASRVGEVYSRASAGTEFDVDGSILYVGNNVKRDKDYLFGTRGMRMEGAATQILNRLAPSLLQYNTRAGATLADVPAFDGVGGFAKWLRVGYDAAATQVAYQTALPLASTQYTIQCVVEMEDLGVPVPGGAGSGDFNLVIGGFVPTSGFRTIRLGTTTRYLIQAPFVTGASPVSNNGINKRPAHSNRPFRITGWQVELGAVGTSLINSTGAPLARVADSYVLPGVAVTGPATLYQKYYDLATNAWVETVTPYVSLATTALVTGRSYAAIAILDGTLTIAQALSVLQLRGKVLFDSTRTDGLKTTRLPSNKLVFY